MSKSKLLDFSFSFLKESRRERIFSKDRNVSGVNHMIPPFRGKDLELCYYVRFGRCKSFTVIKRIRKHTEIC